MLRKEEKTAVIEANRLSESNMKIKKVLSIIMMAIVTLSILTFSASAESIFDTAKQISSGKKVTAKLSNPDDTADYKISVAKSGTLTIKFTCDSAFEIYCMDKDGGLVKRDELELNSGYEIGEEICVDNGTEISSGTIKYSVKKGTYYIRIKKTGSKVNSSHTITATFPADSKSESKITCLKITVPKGTEMQLDAEISGKGRVEWKTSDPDVVDVSSKGKITAEGKGTATITATLGKSTTKIKIKVI